MKQTKSIGMKQTKSIGMKQIMLAVGEVFNTAATLRPMRSHWEFHLWKCLHTVPQIPGLCIPPSALEHLNLTAEQSIADEGQEDFAQDFLHGAAITYWVFCYY